NPGGKFAHRDGKKWGLHRFSHDFAKACLDPVVAAYTDFIFLFVRRCKKRQPLDMIPMSMRDQQREVDRLRLQFLLQRDPKGANSGTGIEHDNLVIRAYFDTGGVSSIAQRARSLDGNGTARAPKLESCGRC